jgi:hypothetical protein
MGKKATIQHVFRDWVLGFGIRCAAKSFALPTFDADFSHQPRNPLTSATDAGLTQGAMNTRASVRFTTLAMNLNDFLGNRRISFIAIACFALAPCVISGLRRLQNRAHPSHAVLLFMSLSELVFR